MIASSGSYPELFALSKVALLHAVDSYPRLASKLQQEMAARQMMRQKLEREQEEGETEETVDD